MKKRSFVVTWTVGLALLGALPAGAQAPVSDASVTEMVDRLAPAPAQATTRSLRNLAPQKRELDLVIQFDFDSARLQAASQPLLERLAEAMNTPRLAPTRFLVQGHTDGKGAPAYNEGLSARRAATVVQFLQSRGVATERLQSEGKGASDLLRRDQPEAAENRRVRIVALE